MSETEHHTGNIRKVETEDVEVFIQALLKASEFPPAYDSWLEYFNCDVYPKKFDGVEYIVLDDTLYQFDEHIESDWTPFVRMWPQEDGSILFTTQFYNGGTCLEEMLADGLKEL